MSWYVRKDDLTFLAWVGVLPNLTVAERTNFLFPSLLMEVFKSISVVPQLSRSLYNCLTSVILVSDQLHLLIAMRELCPF